MSPPPDQSSSQPANQNTNPPQPTELYPMTDIRFVLLRIGELSAKVDRLIDDVSKQGKKVEEVRDKITFVRGAVWVLLGALTLATGIFVAYLSGKFKIIIR